MIIRLAHSPDPDDAFMFYGLATGAVDAGPYQFEHILEDIQTLNERALRGEYEISAISLHTYPYVADKYALSACGCSMGDNYGPMIVSREPFSVEQLRGRTIAVPGLMTTAYLALQLLLGRGKALNPSQVEEQILAQAPAGPTTFDAHVLMFDEIPAAVKQGRFDAGLIIHEGQLTYEKDGLHLVVDLGNWWMQRTGLPLPLGGNVVRRDLGPQICGDLVRIMRASIAYSLDHREPAVRYSLRFGRGLDEALADRFVGMYVNKWTLDYGPRGREAVERLLSEGVRAGLCRPVTELDFVE